MSAPDWRVFRQGCVRITWTKSDIREARKADLVPILTKRGYRLRTLENGNFAILALLPSAQNVSTHHPIGVVVKRNFWIWPDHDLSGNTIDFFVKLEKQSFHQAMEIITLYDSSEHNLREERENVPKILR